MMKARRIDSVLNVHVEVDHIQQHLQHRRNDTRPARRTQHQERLAVAHHDGRSHRRERPLARLNRIGLALHQSKQCSALRLGSEIIHFVVEQKAQAGNGNAAAVTIVQRVSNRDRVARRVDDRIVRGLRAFARRPASRD